MKKEPRVYLAHILECINKIQLYTKKGKANFLKDTLVQDAVIRNFEVIGEAVKRIPEEYRVQNPSIPWRVMAGFRDVLIHNYEGMDVKRVWQIVENGLPQVKQAVAVLLPPLEQLEREISGENEPQISSNAGNKRT
jgi:uncharacterized protein with HEPN domain